MTTTMQFIKDESGRIVKVVDGNKCAVVTWNEEETLDTDFCNFVVQIACARRGVGGVLDE